MTPDAREHALAEIACLESILELVDSEWADAAPPMAEDHGRGVHKHAMDLAWPNAIETVTKLIAQLIHTRRKTLKGCES